MKSFLADVGVSYNSLVKIFAGKKMNFLFSFYDLTVLDRSDSRRKI